MSIEELLRPRYKIIADYFYSPYKVGDIITVLYDGHTVHLTTTHDRDEFGEEIDQQNRFHPDRLQDYPHLFQPLPWWAERKPEDMPEYVKCIDTPDQKIMHGQKFKVKWCAPGTGRTATGQWIFADTNCYVPATEAEYTAYINQTQQP